MAGWANVPAGKNKYDRLTRGGVTKYWSPGLLGLGGSYQTAATLNAQRQKEGKKPIDFTKIGVPKSTPAPSRPAPPAPSRPAPQIGSKDAEGKFYTGPKWGWQSWETTRAKRLLPDEVIGSEPPQSKPKPKPETRTPAPTTPPATRTPAPTTPPATRTPAASATTPPSSQDGIKQWASIYGPGGPKELKSPTERQKQIFSSIKSGQEIPKVRSIKQDVEDIRKMKTTTTESLHTKYDAFDLILEYLASQGHVETLDEALYVMMEMDEEVIQDIVSEAYDNIIVSHLLDEGYAETPEAAEVIMVNMSEDWRESIVEGAVPMPTLTGTGGTGSDVRKKPVPMPTLTGTGGTGRKPVPMPTLKGTKGTSTLRY